MAADGNQLDDLTVKLRGRTSVVTEDAIAYVAADLDRRAIDPAVWRELSAHQLLDIIDVPRAGSFLPYSLSERLTVCARRAGGEAPPVSDVRPAAPVPAPVEREAVTEVLTAIQAELAALRQLIEALGAELRERLEAVQEEVLTARGVLGPGPGADPEPVAAPPPRRRRTAWVVVLLVTCVAVVAGVLLILFASELEAWL